MHLKYPHHVILVFARAQDTPHKIPLCTMFWSIREVVKVDAVNKLKDMINEYNFDILGIIEPKNLLEKTIIGLT